MRHMERQDPQGEENGDHNLASYHYLNRLAGADPQLFQNNPLLRMQLQHHYHQQMMRPSLYLGSGNSTPMAGSRMATPTVGPMLMNPKSLIDSPGVFPNAIMPRSLHDELWAGAAGARIRPSSPMVTSAGGTLLPMSMSSGVESSLSKLNPSVYSHPNAQDPVLMLPKSLHGRDLAVLGGRRANVDVTSSGAFFDPRAVSKPVGPKDSSQMEILAQLTREMRLQQQAGSGLFSCSSDAVSSSSGGSANHLNQIPTTSGASSANASPTKIPASVASATLSASSGYNSGNSSGLIIENRRHNLKASSASSLLTTETSPMSNTMTSNETSANSSRVDGNNVGNNGGNNVGMGEKQKLSTESASMSQPDLFTSIDSPESDVATVVTYAVTSHSSNTNNNAAVNSILESLKNENRDMKAEILDLRKKVGKVSVLEEEMSKVHEAYQSLLKHSEKRELLEKAARARLQAVIMNLSDANKVRLLFHSINQKGLF